MKPRPLAVDPKSFERSGVDPPGERAGLGIRSVIAQWPPQSDREEPSSGARAQPWSGWSPRPQRGLPHGDGPLGRPLGGAVLIPRPLAEEPHLTHEAVVMGQSGLSIEDVRLRHSGVFSRRDASRL